MTGIYFIMPTLLTIFISFLVVRASAIALMMTGMDKNRAVFQALSAFTGTGFTTKEAERVMHHPVRRKIVSWLMIFGNAGIITVIITATSSLVTSEGYRLPVNFIVLFVGIFVIYRIATSKGFIRRWEGFIENRLVKSQAFEEEAVEDLLHLIEGYGLVRAIITEKSALVGETLSGFHPAKGNLLVLGIEREKNWIPVPKASVKILEGDKLVVYGRLDVLRDLFKEA